MTIRPKRAAALSRAAAPWRALGQRLHRPGWFRGTRGWLAVAVAVLALVAGSAAWALWSWHGSVQRGLAYEQAKGAALRAGVHAVQDFNTVDYRQADQGLELWARSSAGALHRQVVSQRAAFEREITRARTNTRATVLHAALTALDTQAGTASISAAIQLTVTPPRGVAVTRRSQLVGQLVLTRAGWKLSSLGQLSGQPAMPGNG